ncbi:DUF2252 family protein [Clostridium sp. DJ247]|uniref:DUF2252 family protein n=1 Tax=Clostridium sp. DJ247 TaxID=2726188 RepID=UPI00162AD9C9|nr:DUF2252 family protein [Clostridium sp. DJ247]MBC2578756.1 DUF2252 family protein [Clostridium sp. DJ247]
MKRTWSKFLALLVSTIIITLQITTVYSADSSLTRQNYIKQQITGANAFITDSNVKQNKYTQMSTSAFNFFRATNHLYYSDLGSGVINVPSQWKTTSNINTWIQGDFHTQNIGFFENKNGEVIFDLNDSDESYVAPFYWDLIRFCTSIFLMTGESNVNLSMQDKRDLTTYFLQKYQDTLNEVNGNNNETTTQLDESYLTSGFVQDRMRNLKSSKSLSDLLNKWTTISNSKRVFNMANTDLTGVTSTERTNITSNYYTYLNDIGSFYTSKGSSYFTIKDVVRRLNSGLGSLGVDKFYILIEGSTSSNSDDQILEVKEQKKPSMFLEGSISQSQYNSWFINDAQRSKTAQKADGIRVDDHLGVETFGGKSYRVTRISPFKNSFDSTDFKSRSDIEDFLKYSAKALAYAHARSDKDYNTTYVNYNFEAGALNAIAIWPQFKTTVSTLSENYYNQVLADYSMFTYLVNTGQME